MAREYPEIRSEIARQTAALIQRARHGVVKDLARLIRTAVNSWRLLQEVEDKASPDFSKGWVHRDPGFEKIVLRERFVSEAGEPDADRV
jgi:hypothetical protein